jgi:O-antigen/teichoic acid export membrane protein
MIVWPGFLASIYAIGLPTSLIFNLKRFPERQSSLVGMALALGAVFGILAGVTGVWFAPLWLARYGPIVVWHARVFMVYAPVALLLLIGRAALEAALHFRESNLALWTAPFLTLLLLTLLASTGKLTPVPAALAYLLGPVPIFGWMLLRIAKIYSLKCCLDWRAGACLLRYGVRSYGVDLMSSLVLVIDQVFVLRLLPPSSVGVYVVAANLARTLNVIASSVVTVLFPRTAARPREEVFRITARALRVSTGLSSIALAIVLALAPHALRYLYGAAYLEGTGVLYLLALDAMVSGCIQVLAQAFLAAGHPVAITLIQTGGVGLGIVLMVAFVPGFGMLGVGIATLIATVARLIITLASLMFVLDMAPLTFLFPKPLPAK